MISQILTHYNYKKKIVNDLLYLFIDNNDVYEILSLLKHNGFMTLIDCFAGNNINDNNSNTIYYHLLNYTNNQSICVCTTLTNKITESIINIFENANWYEREIYEMYNINFIGHNNLKKLFTE